MNSYCIKCSSGATLFLLANDSLSLGGGQMKFLKLCFKNWIMPIAIGITIAVLIQKFIVIGATVDGLSMMPNLSNNEKVIESKLSTIKRGDVVVFDARDEDPAISAGKKYYVKRVIGIGGDTVEQRNSKLFVNGKEVNQSYIDFYQQSEGTGLNWQLSNLSKKHGWQEKDQNQTRVPKGTYFVLGDNRMLSNDSRSYGFIDKSHILGKAIVPFWQQNKQAKENINHQAKSFFVN